MRHQRLEAALAEDDPDPIIVALRDLLGSEGWRVLKAQAAEEWGPQGYGRRMQEALSTVPAGPDRPYELARIAEQVDATARAVNALIKWPAEEISRRMPVKPSTRPFAALRRMTT